MMFLHTNSYNGNPLRSPQHSGRKEPTADTSALIGEAARMLWPPVSDRVHHFKVGGALDDLRGA